MMTKSPVSKPGTAGEAGALPPWVVAVVLAGVLLAAVLIGGFVLRAASPSAGPDLPVHPGMYDLRAEMQKGMAAHAAKKGSHP